MIGDWRHHASCLTQDPDLFFPTGTSAPAVLQLDAARRVCLECPVRPDCLTWALAAGMEHGVWGGMGENERRSLKRRTARGRSVRFPVIRTRGPGPG